MQIDLAELLISFSEQLYSFCKTGLGTGSGEKVYRGSLYKFLGLCSERRNSLHRILKTNKRQLFAFGHFFKMVVFIIFVFTFGYFSSCTSHSRKTL